MSAHVFSGSLLPVTVFDKHSLRVLFTFARDCPPSRPDVLVVIISMLSSAPIPVTNIRFQAAVPRVSAGFPAVRFIYSNDEKGSRTFKLNLPTLRLSDKWKTYLLTNCGYVTTQFFMFQLVCFLGDESKAAASLQYWASRLQSHPASSCYHTDSALGQSSQGLLSSLVSLSESARLFHRYSK